MTSGRTSPGRQATMRAAASSEHCSVDSSPRQKLVLGSMEEPTRCYSGEGPGGEEGPEICTHTSSRRRGGGTYGRSVVTKQGRSRGQPRPGRRAKTRSITSHAGKSAGVVETGGSGRRSDEGRDNTTLLEQRTRGLRWLLRAPEAGGVDNTHRDGKRAGRGRRRYQTDDLRGACRPGA